MSIAAREPEAPAMMTYEDYLAEGEVFKRYDIIDGVREYMTNPTRLHQRVLRRIARAFEDYEAESGRGQSILAPSDVLIRRAPLRTRQPDVLFISTERLALNAPETDPAPLSPAPELVVEVLSPNERRGSRSVKIADYCAVGVLECWIVSPDARTIEVLRLSKQGPQSVATYGEGETAVSITFPSVAVPVASIFAN
jgi:Uma2 family endonuclease